MNDLNQPLCPTCRGPVTVNGDYFTCAACNSMDHVSKMLPATTTAPEQPAAIDRTQMTNADGQTPEVVKAEAELFRQRAEELRMLCIIDQAMIGPDLDPADALALRAILHVYGVPKLLFELVKVENARAELAKRRKDYVLQSRCSAVSQALRDALFHVSVAHNTGL